LSSNDFQKAVKLILSNRALASHVGVELHLPHLTPELLTKLFALDITKEELDAVHVDVWRVLETVAEVGFPGEYPELFDQIMQEALEPGSVAKAPRPAKPSANPPAPEKPEDEKIVWGKLEYLEDDEDVADKLGEEERMPRSPRPSDVLRTMFRARDRFVYGLAKLKQWTLLNALEAGEAARAKDGGKDLAEFEKMVRRWYYLEVVPRARKY
jgi:hypothetical protein